MRSTTLLALALPIVAAFPLKEAASSKHMDKKRAESTQGGGKWTQWDEDEAAMDGSKWAHPQSHEDGSEWAKEGWPESAGDKEGWNFWDEDEAAMDGSKWAKEGWPESAQDKED
ncbi:hypothetical protein G6O67_008015 [Ophiocordyceps sinensis]|uniref:Uncharacterized protein n=2 Tax=Ophiocordyceps sinensis TaxID=72228 RepID=A0A8H4PGI5_9HYPO|nr:hypothetical protein OCS_03369 [Ophiocordyceps sinensis CO18]KAF4504577.1 hypothetical protein G6O67_008015 [Ophiocordyceps sinensis]